MREYKEIKELYRNKKWINKRIRLTNDNYINEEGKEKKENVEKLANLDKLQGNKRTIEKMKKKKMKRNE